MVGFFYVKSGNEEYGKEVETLSQFRTPSNTLDYVKVL